MDTYLAPLTSPSQGSGQHHTLTLIEHRIQSFAEGLHSVFRDIFSLCDLDRVAGRKTRRDVATMRRCRGALQAWRNRPEASTPWFTRTRVETRLSGMFAEVPHTFLLEVYHRRRLPTQFSSITMRTDRTYWVT